MKFACLAEKKFVESLGRSSKFLPRYQQTRKKLKIPAKIPSVEPTLHFLNGHSSYLFNIWAKNLQNSQHRFFFRKSIQIPTLPKILFAVPALHGFINVLATTRIIDGRKPYPFTVAMVGNILANIFLGKLL